MAASGSSVFETSGLKVSYGRAVAIPGLDLVCPTGAVGLLGPNGAGKSSLLKAVLGLVRPAAGAVQVLGHAVPRQAIEVRRRVGYMPESAVSFPGLTGIENVAYAGMISGMPRGEAKRRAHEVLEYVGCGEERYRGVDEYSQGMRQRIKLASALVHDPELLFLDEPTNGLDPGGRTEILSLIHDLSHAKGIHVVVSSHLLDDVEFACDSILVLAQGELKAAGSIAELKQALAGERVRVTADGDGQALLAGLRARGFEAVLPDPLDPNELLVKLPAGGEPMAVLRIARELGIRICRFVPRRASLEEVFLDTLEAGGAEVR